MADCPVCGERDCFYSTGMNSPEWQLEMPEEEQDLSETWECDNCGYEVRREYVFENGQYKKVDEIEL